MQFDLSKNKSHDYQHWFKVDKTTLSNIHPLFQSIAGFNCRVEYNPKYKCFWVDFGYDQTTGKYKRSILSSLIPSIVGDITEYYTEL